MFFLSIDRFVRIETRPCTFASRAVGGAQFIYAVQAEADCFFAQTALKKMQSDRLRRPMHRLEETLKVSCKAVPSNDRGHKRELN